MAKQEQKQERAEGKQSLDCTPTVLVVVVVLVVLLWLWVLLVLFGGEGDEGGCDVSSLVEWKLGGVRVVQNDGLLRVVESC